MVLSAPKESGQWDETIVVLMSDHGYLLGEKFMSGKVMLFETCDRVPLILRVPGQTMPGSTSGGLVELVDLFLTLAELCNVTPPSELQGQSLVPMLRDPATIGTEVAYTVVTRGKQTVKFDETGFVCGDVAVVSRCRVGCRFRPSPLHPFLGKQIWFDEMLDVADAFFQRTLK